jgi:rhodanese-related sulfurtransferase
MQQISQFIIHHWTLWLGLVAILLAIYINEFLAQKKRAKELSPQAAIALINDNEQTVVIDLRDSDSYRKGHIINAIHATVDDFEHQRLNKYKTAFLILVCSKGLQSITLAAKLREQGFSHPQVLAGGMNAWQQAALPTVKGK